MYWGLPIVALLLVAGSAAWAWQRASAPANPQEVATYSAEDSNSVQRLPTASAASEVANVENKYVRQRICLDGGRFERCVFEECELSYAGGTVPILIGCTFKNVNWTMSDAAANTLRFLSLLHNGAGDGGRALVEELLQRIRKAKHNAPQSPQTARRAVER